MEKKSCESVDDLLNTLKTDFSIGGGDELITSHKQNLLELKSVVEKANKKQTIPTVSSSGGEEGKKLAEALTGRMKLLLKEIDGALAKVDDDQDESSHQA